ncbi:MAG: SCO family protein [bacterium]|nr:SCO family protein [bacterium]
MARMLWMLILLLGAGLCGPASAAPNPAAVKLVDQRGVVFSLESLHGRPVILTFVATRCTDACPIANATFQRLQGRLRAARADALLLTVTLDPAYDTPFVMSREARMMGADPRTWRMASGTASNVRAVMRAFDVVTQVDRSGVPDVHSTLIYILDRRGRLAKRLLLSTDTVNEVLTALPRTTAARSSL